MESGGLQSVCCSTRSIFDTSKHTFLFIGRYFSMASKKGKVEAPVVEAPKEPEIVTGHGEFSFPDGSFYEGDWKETQGVKVREGHGTYICGPEKYVGSWVNDRIQGKGEYHYSSGAVYTGDFQDGMMHGEGEYIFPDGASYKGQWMANKMHGQGTYLDKEKVEYGGRFVNGLFDSGKSYISVRNVGIK